jgi:hypothetical protein
MMAAGDVGAGMRVQVPHRTATQQLGDAIGVNLDDMLATARRIVGGNDFIPDSPKFSQVAGANVGPSTNVYAALQELSDAAVQFSERLQEAVEESAVKIIGAAQDLTATDEQMGALLKALAADDVLSRLGTDSGDAGTTGSPSDQSGNTGWEG